MSETPGPLRWIAVLALVTAIEMTALRNKDADATFSYFTRAVFATDTRLGQAAFCGVLAGGSAWFAFHILTGPLLVPEETS